MLSNKAITVGQKIGRILNNALYGKWPGVHSAEK